MVLDLLVHLSIITLLDFPLPHTDIQTLENGKMVPPALLMCALWSLSIDGFIHYWHQFTDVLTKVTSPRLTNRLVVR
jgi:hypothetical protein